MDAVDLRTVVWLTAMVDPTMSPEARAKFHFQVQNRKVEKRLTVITRKESVPTTTLSEPDNNGEILPCTSPQFSFHIYVGMYIIAERIDNNKYIQCADRSLNVFLHAERTSIC